MSDQSRSVADQVAGLRRYVGRVNRWVSGGEATDADGSHGDPHQGERGRGNRDRDATQGRNATHERPDHRERGETARRDRATVTPEALADVDPEDLETKADVQMLLGLTPTEFVMQLLNAHDGELEQQAFTDYTDWSPSTVSRVLQELEEDDRIVRVRIGRAKTVYLPDRAPVDPSDARTDGDDVPLP